MGTSNEKILRTVEKADLEVASLIANGGYLPDDQAKAFIVDMIKEAKLLPLIRVEGIKSHTKLIDRIGLDGRVLHPGTSGQALSLADRTAPVTEQATLETKLFKGEIRLSNEALEDNIEQGKLKDTVLKMMKEQVATDLDEITAKGDTASADPYLAQFDGMIKLATAHTVNAGTNPIQKEYLKRAIKAMPSQFNRMKDRQVFLTSEGAEIDYRDYLANRATVLGDKFVTGADPVVYGSRPILPIPVFPENLGMATNETVCLLLDPKLAFLGIWRDIMLEPDYDTRAGVWYVVVSMRVGFQYVDADGVVKIYGVQVTP